MVGVRVPLRRSARHAVVSVQDMWALDHRWYIARVGGLSTAVTHRDGALVTLAHLIMEAGEGRVVTHRNKDGLCCLRSNLTVVESAFPHLHSAGASGYKGVGRTPGGRWKAEVNRGGRRRYLGNFATAEEAAQAVEVASEEGGT